MYQVKVFTCIDEIDRLAWEHLNASQPFSKQFWLNFSAACLKQFKPLVVLLYKNHSPVGRAIFTIERQATGVSLFPGIRLVNTLLRHYPLLLCQTPMANLSGLLLPKNEEAQALQTIEHAVLDAAASQKISFSLFGFLTDKEMQLIRQGCNYIIVPMEPTTLLEVTWSSFEEYIANLTKSARKDYHQHTNHANKMNMAIERSHQFAQYEDDLWRLLSSVAQRHGSIDQIAYTKRIFTEVERQLPPSNYAMLIARVENTVAGCGLLLHDEGTMILTVLGLDYHFKYTYFRLFYEAIRYATDNKIRLIRGGSGAYEFKQRLGFKLEPTFVAFSSPHVVFRQLGAAIVRSMRHPEVKGQSGA
jgi:predicted N-acyltransferase